MTLLQRVFNSFHRLISKLDKDDEVEVVLDEHDPYVVDIVKRLDSLRSKADQKRREVA